MSCIGGPTKEIPLRVPYAFATQLAGMIDPKTNFSEIMSILKKTKHIPEDISEKDEKNLVIEFERARTWVEKYSPEQLINISNEKMNDLGEWKELFEKSIKIIQESDAPDDIQQKIYETTKELNLQMKDAFKTFYKILIGRERGPRLGTLIIALGKEKVIQRIKGVL